MDSNVDDIQLLTVRKLIQHTFLAMLSLFTAHMPFHNVPAQPLTRSRSWMLELRCQLLCLASRMRLSTYFCFVSLCSTRKAEPKAPLPICRNCLYAAPGSGRVADVLVSCEGV